MDWAKGRFRVGLMAGAVCVALGGCGGSTHVRAARAVETDFLAQSSGRADELRWSESRSTVTGSLQTLSIDPAAPTFLKAAEAGFSGSLSGSRVVLRPLSGSGDWHGRLVRGDLTLTWRSGGSTITTTFVRADSQTLDAAQQALDQQVGAAQEQLAEASGVAGQQSEAGAKQASDAARAAAAQEAAARRAAQQAVAQARAAAGRASAAKAAQHHHP